MWKDSTGAIAPVVRHVGGFAGGNPPFQAVYEVIDPVSEAVFTYQPGRNPEVYAGYAFLGWVSNDCTGTPYVVFLSPARYAVQLPTQPGKYYKLPDSPAATVMAFLSWRSDAQQNCQPAGISGPAILASALVEIQLPAGPPGTPPYHPELQ